MEWKGRRAVLYWGAHPSHPNLHLLTGLGFALRRRAGLKGSLFSLFFKETEVRKSDRPAEKGACEIAARRRFFLNQSSRRTRLLCQIAAPRRKLVALHLARRCAIAQLQRKTCVRHRKYKLLPVDARKPDTCPPRKAEWAGSRPRARPDI